MNITLDWIHLVTLVGAVQGFLLAGVLAAHRTNRTANRLLAVLMATFSVYLLQEVAYATGTLRAYPHVFGISYPLPWVFGPLVYLYAVAASDRARRFQPRDLLHFVLPLIIVLAGLPIYMMSGADKLALMDRLAAGDFPTVMKIFDPTKYVSGISYSAATLLHLHRHRRRIEYTYSNIERVNLAWLIWLSGGAAAVWLLAVVVGFANKLPLPNQRHGDDLVALAVALLVYAIGYTGLRQPEVFRYDEPAPTSPPSVPPLAEESQQPEEPRVELRLERGERYERSGLRDAEAHALKAALLALMTKERPYRDPDLTLPDLADRLDTTPHKLSEVLNSELSQTFYDFINSYRVDDVRHRLAKSESRNLNLLTLAMDAGFASKSTFNQVFKKQTGQTPSMYRKAIAS